jgi:heat-inducible transcriptional repressor
MVRNVDYESRRRAVLTATINRYIDEATPVASEDLAEEFDLSPATIRNIMAELEKEGYITHPYTSGGRLPTTRGYRYYVDFLLAQMELLEAEKAHISNEYKKEIGRLEDALEKTSRVISMITHYAGIVSFLDWQDRIFYQGIGQILEQPEFKDYAHLRMIVKLIEEKGHLLDIINRDFKEKVKVYIGDELACPGMENCALVVSSYKLKNKSLGRLAVLGPQRMEYRHTIPALEYISGVLSEVLERI